MWFNGKTFTVEHFIFVRALFSYAGQMYENKAYENKGRTKILAYKYIRGILYLSENQQ